MEAPRQKDWATRVTNDVDCTIRNLSDKGARLQVPTTVAIPDRFTFVDDDERAVREDDLPALQDPLPLTFPLLVHGGRRPPA